MFSELPVLDTLYMYCVSVLQNKAKDCFSLRSQCTQYLESMLFISTRQPPKFSKILYGVLEVRMKINKYITRKASYSSLTVSLVPREGKLSACLGINQKQTNRYDLTFV